MFVCFNEKAGLQDDYDYMTYPKSHSWSPEEQGFGQKGRTLDLNPRSVASFKQLCGGAAFVCAGLTCTWTQAHAGMQGVSAASAVLAKDSGSKTSQPNFQT